MNARTYLIAIVVLATADLLLLHQNLTLKKRPTAVLTPIGRYVNETSLPDVPVSGRDGLSRSLRQLTRHAPFTLLVFFSPSDCPSCFSEAELWREVPNQRDIPVYGVGNCASLGEFWQWTDQEDFGIDTYADTTFSVADRMHFSVTPLKVLCDSTGTILWADPPRQPGRDRDLFWRDLDYALVSR